MTMLRNYGFSCIFTLVIGASSLGCAGPTQMTPAANAPFTEGEVDASYKDNGNGSVTVRVKNLGDASKLRARATTYVVWLTPDGTDKQQNAGALKVDSDQEGELSFNTTFKKYKLAVTPEASADVSSPSGNSVLSAEVVAQ